MNFLAHAYLSFGQPDLLVGNMISDCVKGKDQYNYPESIQQGIRLHRAIDDYTDRHKATAKAKELFRPAYRLYSAPITDIVFDYFLANDTSIFSEQRLYDFTTETYATLDGHNSFFPLPFALMFPYMKKDNWLFNYRTEAGIYKSIRGLMRRASIQDDGARACATFSHYLPQLQACYEALMPDVKDFAKDWLNKNG